MYNQLFRSKKLVALLLLAGSLSAAAQEKKPVVPAANGTTPAAPASLPAFPKTGPKAYKEIITDKAISKKGLFTVHKVEDKWYFEIADSILNREILAVTRFSKTAAGGNSYGGEEVNEQTIRWEKGPSNNVFLRVITIVS